MVRWDGISRIHYTRKSGGPEGGGAFVAWGHTESVSQETASNQLVAALALIIVSSYLVGLKRPAKYTLYPAYFMLITTLAALFYQGYRFFTGGKILLGCVSVALILLAAFIVYEARAVLFHLNHHHHKQDR